MQAWCGWIPADAPAGLRQLFQPGGEPIGVTFAAQGGNFGE